MARLRKFSSYQRIERPYTRKSKFKKKDFIRGAPPLRVVAFDMGDLRKEFESSVDLVSRRDVQVRQNSIESARLATNRFLEKNLGKTAFHFKIRIYPHHVLRENPLASGAGADRMSTGMQKSFGKPIGIAAQVRKGQTIFTVSVAKSNIDIAKTALKRGSHKLPCACSVQIVE